MMRGYTIRWMLCLLALAPAALAQDAEKRTCERVLKEAEEQQSVRDTAQTALDDATEKWNKKSDDEALTTAKEETNTARDAAQVKFDGILEKLATATDALEEKGGDGQAYNEYLIANGIPRADFGAALGLVEDWTLKAKDWVVEKGPGIATKAGVFLLILLLFRFLARITGRVAERALKTSKLKVSDLLKNFFVTVAQKLVMVIGILAALQYVEAPIGPLLAGVGVLGFVVGFALQDTLGNFASGIMILLYRPYDIGDVIKGAGTAGKVEAMSLVSTTLLTPDNQVVIVPNNAIWGSTITNVTANATRRVDLTFGVGYGDDLDKAEEMIRAVVTAHPLVMKTPEPQIKVSNLGESSVDFVVRPWCKTSDYWDVFFDLQKQLKQRADTDGIEIPFPQRDVHIHQAAGGEQES